MSCHASEALSGLLIVVTVDVLIIDSHIGGVAGAVRKAVGTRRSFDTFKMGLTYTCFWRVTASLVVCCTVR